MYCKLICLSIFLFQTTITSENNSYGILESTWLEGQPMIIESNFAKEKNYLPMVNLKMKKVVRLSKTSKSNCTVFETFYTCMASKMKCSENCTYFLKQEYYNVNKNDEMLPFCQHKNERKCYLETNSKIHESFYQCPSSCTQDTYYGDTTFVEQLSIRNENVTGLSIIFTSKDVHEEVETLAYGLPEVIGSVGGTLGLFIGFSFYGFVSIPLQKLYNN